MFELFNPASARVCQLTGLIKEIGRSKSADISLAEDRKVSRNHARLEKEGEGWVIVDLSSTNGTYVNGNKVDQHKLIPGDEIRIGGTTLIYRTAAEPAEKEEATRVDISMPRLTSRIRKAFKSRKNK